MRKTMATLALAAGFTTVMVVPAVAAELSNGDGQSCDGAGTWHFVNNQTRGAATGTLTAKFNGGDIMVTVSAEQVSRNNQHFYVTTDASATLDSASTDLPGRLVLSDFECDGGGKEPPPKK